MKDHELKAETGKYAVNAPPIEMFAFGELILDVRGPFFERMATFMVACAGLMSAFDEARYGNYMDSIPQTVAGNNLSHADRDKIKDPVYGVLRHVRNAVAHGNTWSFSDREPSRPARSPNFEINPQTGDTNPLQGKPCFYGSLMPANPLFLVRDVEIPLMKP